MFATRARFPEADEVVVDWPHRFLARVLDTVDSRTALCVLTHDPKFDVPLLEVALRLPQVAYIGAMGSRRTHEERLTQLKERGLTDAELEGLPGAVYRFRQMPLADEVARLAEEVLRQSQGGETGSTQA